MPRQRIFRQWFRTALRGHRKSCPHCHAKLAPGECIWSWGYYHTGKFRANRDVCRECWNDVAGLIRRHFATVPNSTVELCCKGAQQPEWMTLDETVIDAMRKEVEKCRLQNS